MKAKVQPFGNNQVLLRLIEEKDLPRTLSWRNDDNIRTWFKNKEKITTDQHNNWFKNYSKKKDDFLFIIEANTQAIGQASIYNIDTDQKSAEIGRFLISRENQGKGYMSSACKELIKFSQEQLGLNYLFLEVFENNKKAIKIYMENGFEVEKNTNGLMRMGVNLKK